MRTQVIGIAWDKFNSRLKAEVLRDLLKLKEALPELMVQMQAPDSNVSWLKALCEYAECPMVVGRDPSLWRVYITVQEPELPPYASDIIRKDMRIVKKPPVYMKPNAEHYPVLDRQSDHREVPVGMSISLDMTPPARAKGNQPVVLPRNYFYSPFISLCCLCVTFYITYSNSFVVS